MILKWIINISLIISASVVDGSSIDNNPGTVSIQENYDGTHNMWTISATCYVRYTYQYTCYTKRYQDCGWWDWEWAACTYYVAYTCYAHAYTDVECNVCTITSDSSGNFQMSGKTVQKKTCQDQYCGPTCNADGCLNGGASHNVGVACHRTGYETNGRVTGSFTVSVYNANGPSFYYNAGSSISVSHDSAGVGTVINRLVASTADNGNDYDYARYRQAAGPDPSYLHSTTDIFYLDTSTAEVKVGKSLASEFSYWYDMNLCVYDRRNREVCHTLDITLWACFQTPNCTDQTNLHIHDTYGNYTGHGGDSNTIFDMIFPEPSEHFPSFSSVWHQLTWTFDSNEFPEATINSETGEIYITSNISIWPSWPTKDYNMVVRVANSESCYTTTCSFHVRIHYTNWPISIRSLPTTYYMHEDYDWQKAIHRVVTYDYNYSWEDNVTCYITDWNPHEDNMFELRQDGNYAYNSYTLYKLACQTPDCGYKYSLPQPYYCYTDIGCLTHNRTQVYTVDIKCDDAYNTSDHETFTFRVVKNEVPEYRHLPTTIALDRNTVAQYDKIFEIMYSDQEDEDLIYEYTFEDVETNIDPGYFLGDLRGNYYDNLANVTMTTYLHDKPVNKTYKIQICGHERRNEICDPLHVHVQEYCSDTPTCNDASFSTDSTFTIGDTLFDIKSLVSGGTFADEDLSFSIRARDGNLFSVDSSSGIVSTAAEFPEVFPSETYSIIGYVYNDGSCSYGQCQLTVTVTAVNYAPEITNLPDKVDIHEDITTAQTLFTVGVSDENTDDTYTCEIVNTNSVEPFYLDRIPPVSGDYMFKNRDNGILSSATTTYSVSIACVDSHGDSDTGVLTVEVQLNEAPTFIGFTGGASINADLMDYSLGDKIYSVSVSDTENDQLVFTATNAKSNVPFQYEIYDTYINVIISRDLRINDDNGQTYEATICVRDAKHADLCGVLAVHFTRAKTYPRITNLDDRVSFPEDTSLGTTIFEPTIEDPDAGETHTFSISLNPSTGLTSFDLDTATGTLSLVQTLDYEQESLFMFTYNVWDDYLSAEYLKTLILDVTNVNEDNTITAEYTTLSFSEDTLINTELPDAGFTCVDEDGDVTSFAIAGGDHMSYFSIDSTTGRLTLLQEWDLESGLPPSTSLTISCTDPGGLSSTVDIFINIEGVNDNRPNIITSDEPMISINPLTCLCTNLMTFDASDNDVGDDGQFEYSILGSGLGSRIFRMVPVAGTTQAKLRLKATPSFRNDKMFRITVQVSDGEAKSLSSGMTIAVNYTSGDPDVKSKEDTKCMTCTSNGRTIIAVLIVEAVVCVLFGLHVLYTCFCGAKTISRFDKRLGKMDISQNKRFKNTAKQTGKKQPGKSKVTSIEMEERNSREKHDTNSSSSSSSSDSSDDDRIRPIRVDVGNRKFHLKNSKVILPKSSISGLPSPMYSSEVKRL